MRKIILTIILSMFLISAVSASLDDVSSNTPNLRPKATTSTGGTTYINNSYINITYFLGLNGTDGVNGSDGADGADGIDGVNGSVDYSNVVMLNQTNTGNVTISGTGFFTWLGDLTSRITKLFVEDVDVSNNINVTGNVTANLFKVRDTSGTMGGNETCLIMLSPNGLSQLQLCN